MRYSTILVSLFLVFSLVACDEMRPPRPTQYTKPQTLDFSKMDEVNKRIRERQEKEEREETEQQHKAEAEQQEKISALVKKYALEDKPVPELVKLVNEAREGSDIWIALDQAVRRKTPEYLLTLTLEQLAQMAEGDEAKEDHYFGPFSTLNKGWLAAVREKEGGSEFLLSLYFRISVDWVGDPRCGELRQEALDGFNKKLANASISENIATIDKLIVDNEEVIDRMKWKRRDLANTAAQAVMDQLNQLPEQDPKVLWQYLETLKKANLESSGLYQEAKEILRRNNFSLEDEVKLSNF